MRQPKAEQIQRIAARLLQELEALGVMHCKGSRPQLQGVVAGVISRQYQELEILDRDARALLAQHLRSAPAGLDQQKMLQMIRKKLAADRGVVL